MYLVVREPTLRETRWYGLPRRGALSIGVAPEGDVQLSGHNLAARHVQLAVGPRERIRLDIRHAWGVRLNGLPPGSQARFAPGDSLAIGTWQLALEEAPPAPSTPIDALLAHDASAEDRLVYADSLEERGLVAEAELVRATLGAPAQPRLAALAVRTPPAFRRRLLALPIEACPRPDDAELPCPGRWVDLPPDGTCPTCARRVVYCSDIGTARQEARAGRPVVLDPAIRRWPDDLREPARKRLAIEMGRPTGR